MRIALIILASSVLFLSCDKDKKAEKEGYSEIPAIELVSVNKTTMVQFQDSMIITIKFKDLNGDLGRQDPDDNSLYIKDQRLPAADYYHIPPITPEDLEFKTRGTIRIVVPTLFLLGNGGDEKTVLTVKVKDQADHWSNEITTPQITVTQ